jgi:hypothetical protein
MITKEQIASAGREVSRLGRMHYLDPRANDYTAALKRYNDLKSEFHNQCELGMEILVCGEHRPKGTQHPCNGCERAFECSA